MSQVIERLTPVVTPAQAGAQTPTKRRRFASIFSVVLGPGLRRGDGSAFV